METGHRDNSYLDQNFPFSILGLLFLLVYNDSLYHATYLSKHKNVNCLNSNTCFIEFEEVDPISKYFCAILLQFFNAVNLTKKFCTFQFSNVNFILNGQHISDSSCQN